MPLFITPGFLSLQTFTLAVTAECEKKRTTDATSFG